MPLSSLRQPALRKGALHFHYLGIKKNGDTPCPSRSSSFLASVRFCPWCSGQPIPDSGLSFSSATAGGNPSLN
ncbi:hypothetical protein APB44_29700 [Pseudomonas aeruginosa]|nr:hypothetical protein APB44_29700 [Pseudomonas aeruginosa]